MTQIIIYCQVGDIKAEVAVSVEASEVGVEDLAVVVQDVGGAVGEEGVSKSEGEVSSPIRNVYPLTR